MSLLVLGIVIVLSLATIIIADLIRRYYSTKFEYEYMAERLEHDTAVLTADVGFEEVEREEDGP